MIKQDMYFFFPHFKNVTTPFLQICIDGRRTLSTFSHLARKSSPNTSGSFTSTAGLKSESRPREEE